MLTILLLVLTLINLFYPKKFLTVFNLLVYANMFIYTITFNSITTYLLITLMIINYLKLIIYPIRSYSNISLRNKIIDHGRYNLSTSIYVIILLIITQIVLFNILELNMFLINLLISITIIYNYLFYGYLKIMILSKRLRLIRRVIILTLIWIPIINIFVLLYLIKISKTELIHALEQADLANKRVDSDLCSTKYPILLLHGVGFRDLKYINYWGRIPKKLEQNGAVIYYGNQEAFSSGVDNGLDIQKRIFEILRETGAAKVNIIAHSKGGLDARYTISSLHMGQYVASLTTMGTPHLGCRIIDLIDKVPKKILNIIEKIALNYFKKIGDKDPQFLSVINELRVNNQLEFNKHNLNSDLVYYQSYASVMKHSFSDLILTIPYLLIKKKDGDNDGLVTIESAKWGEFKGVLSNTKYRGISHGDMIDLSREDYNGFNIQELYVTIVNELKNNGF